MRPQRFSNASGGTPPHAASVRAWENSSVQLFTVILLLLGATLITYWPVARFQFLNYDDPVYVTGNPYVQQGLTVASVRWAFQNIEAEFWQPTVWLSHMSDWQFYGARAGGHHVTSLLIHLVNTMLLFILLKRMTGWLGRSAVVAGLFALHPLHVESVAWIAERKDVLSTLFGLLTLHAYAKYAQVKRSVARDETRAVVKKKSGNARSEQWLARGPQLATIYYATGLLGFALSLMSKPLLVTLPFLLLLLDYWPLTRYEPVAENRKFRILLHLCLEKIPYFIMAFASCVATYWIQSHRHNVSGAEQYPLGLRLANAVMSYFAYVRKLFWPSDLAMFYPYPDAWPMGPVIGAGILLLALSALALVQWRRPYVLVGWFWFLGTLIPMIGLVQVSHHAMADRYTYFPLIGLFIILVWGAADLLTALRVGRFVPYVGATAALALCALLAHRQVAHWESSLTLNTHALGLNDNNYIAHANLGAALADERKFDEALLHFQKAFAIESRLRFNPDLPSIRFGLGTALALNGRLDDAKVQFMRLLDVQPDSPKLHHNFATLLMMQGNLNDAISHYERAILLDPNYEEARVNLASALQQRERWSLASEHLQSAERLVRDQRPREAVQEFHAALELRPDWPELMNNVAWLLATEPATDVRNGTEAVALAERACQLTGRTNFLMLSTLAAAYAETGNFTAAATAQQEVCQLARERGQTNQLESFLERLDLYRSGHAFHRPKS